MGMFDSVMVQCPGCGEKVEFQSKAGTCLLEIYEDHVPPEIAADLHGKTRVCEGCNYCVTARYEVPPIDLVKVWGE